MIVVAIFLLSVIVLSVKFKLKRRRLCALVNKFDGPKTIPIFGNAHKTITLSQTGLYGSMVQFRILTENFQPYDSLIV